MSRLAHALARAGTIPVNHTGLANCRATQRVDGGSSGCCCRQAPGSFSSRCGSAAKSCSWSFAAIRWARLVQRARSGQRRSTVATSAESQTYRSLIARLSSICESGDFAVVSASDNIDRAVVNARRFGWPVGVFGLLIAVQQSVQQSTCDAVHFSASAAPPKHPI